MSPEQNASRKITRVLKTYCHKSAKLLLSRTKDFLCELALRRPSLKAGRIVYLYLDLFLKPRHAALISASQ